MVHAIVGIPAAVGSEAVRPPLNLSPDWAPEKAAAVTQMIQEYEAIFAPSAGAGGSLRASGGREIQSVVSAVDDHLQRYGSKPPR